jgi:hypothetical protein
MVRVIYALEPPRLNELSEVPLRAKCCGYKDMNDEGRGVFSGQVNVLHPWEAIPKSRHVKRKQVFILLIAIAHT